MVVALAHFVCLWSCAACTRPEPSQSSLGLTGPHSNQNFSVKHQKTTPIVNLTEFQIPVFPMNLEGADHLQHQHDATFHEKPHPATYHTGESLVDAGAKFPTAAAEYFEFLTAQYPAHTSLKTLTTKSVAFFTAALAIPEYTKQGQVFETWRKDQFLPDIAGKRYDTTNDVSIKQAVDTLEMRIAAWPSSEVVSTKEKKIPPGVESYLDSLIAKTKYNSTKHSAIQKLKAKAVEYYGMHPGNKLNELGNIQQRSTFKVWKDVFIPAIKGRQYETTDDAYIERSLSALNCFIGKFRSAATVSSSM